MLTDTKRNSWKKSGNFLLKSARSMLSRAFDVKPKTISSQYLKNLIKSETGITNIWLADSGCNYYYLDLDTVLDILNYDLISEREYLDNGRFDCDKFARAVYTRFNYIYGVNTMAMARNVEIRNLKTDELMGYHRANVFVAEDEGKLKVFYLEPQTDMAVELNGSSVELFEKKYVLAGMLDF